MEWYGIATESDETGAGDIIASVTHDDLVTALMFLADTIESFGTEDVAEYIRHRAGREDAADDVSVRRLQTRLTTLAKVLEG